MGKRGWKLLKEWLDTPPGEGPTGKELLGGFTQQAKQQNMPRTSQGPRVSACYCTKCGAMRSVLGDIQWGPAAVAEMHVWWNFHLPRANSGERMFSPSSCECLCREVVWR